MFILYCGRMVLIVALSILLNSRMALASLVIVCWMLKLHQAAIAQMLPRWSLISYSTESLPLYLHQQHQKGALKMGRRYDVIDRLRNRNERPVVEIDAEHKYPINTSKTNVLLIMSEVKKAQKKTEDDPESDIKMIDKIIQIALGKEALDYINESNMTMAATNVHAADNIREVKFTYGALGVLKSREQERHRITFGYNSELQLRRIGNEAGDNYFFELDGLGQVVTEVGFDGLRRKYERDGAGRVTRVNRPGDKWTEYLYDGLDNILKEEQYDGEVSLYTYDKDGMLVKAENSENLLEFTRDRKTGQIIEEKQGEYTVNRTYDSEGNCTRITSSLGADIRHTYDREGNLQTMQAGESWQASWVRDNTGLEVQRTFSGGVTVRTERDCFGREIRKSVWSGGMERGAYRYQWGIANRLLSKENELTGTVTRYDYDRFDFLIRQETMQGSETDVIYRVPDFVGNLFETPDKKDRKYGAGGKLLEDPDCFYHYDDEGNLIFREFKQLQETGVRFDRKRMEKERGIRCLATGTGWLYEWSSNGMLKKVIRPDGRPVEFRYDALGRRTAKQYFGKVTRWVWDGNVPIHEWSYKVTDMQSNKEESASRKEPTEDITTWVFEAGTFVPTAKIQDSKQYSIVSDYIGTPIQMYDELGNKIWDCTLDVYGKATTFEGGSLNECPFRWAGQYLDHETNLCYNRFRYYSSETGSYLSQDSIRLSGNNPTFYGYVKDVNSWIDIWGLSPLLADAPTYAGVYHIVGTNGEKYVGSSVNIAERLTTEHKKAAQIINSGNYTITYYQVDLGTASKQKEINHILRAHEQQIFVSAGYTPLKNGVLNSNNPAAAHKLSGYLSEARKHGAGFIGNPKSKTEIKIKGCH